ncbi:MAG: hypothetical protein KAT62_07605 [Desulfuromonadales bacterium]|nr:hypothetical protein [Desulfuromonadales bacterium]
MNFKIIAIFVLFTLSALIFSNAAIAGPYSDDMTKCLVESTIEEEKNFLVKWMFSAFSVHPSLSSLSSVDQNEREEIHKNCAKMIVKLLTVNCVDQTKKAIKYEGEKSLNAAFETFGSVAAQGIFSNPEVQNELTSLESYMDEDKLKEALGQ